MQQGKSHWSCPMTPSVSNVLHPIFDMNVPEGFLADQIKRRMAKHMQVDEMRLLSVIGGNQIGRLTCKIR
ncbi:HipA N-terminal domain-containing protein [Pseudomonas sp. SDO52101_S400]